MKLIGVLIVSCLKIICVENLMIPEVYQPETTNIEESVTQQEDYDEGFQYENPFRVIGLEEQPVTKAVSERRGRTFGFDKRMNINEHTKKVFKVTWSLTLKSTFKTGHLNWKLVRKYVPCFVVLVSKSHTSPAMQSLLRKYRYDSNGILIPSSVKYFIKMNEEYGSTPVLVPLTGKAFSPLGGFIRYYKEVPPIPPSM